MHNKFAEQTIKIEVDVANKISPFYYNSGISFYKNRLIHVEDIIEQQVVNKGNSADFQSFETKAYHILTFQDEMGNTHEYQSTIKPNNVGSIMYYVTENGKIKDIFSESDKAKFKNHIHIKTEYKYPSKTYQFIDFYFNSIFNVTSMTSLWIFFISALVYLSGHFNDLPDNGPYVVPLIFGMASLIPLIPTSLFVGIKLARKAKIFTREKQDEEKEAILKTFI